jgi:ribosome-binding factor A
MTARGIQQSRYAAASTYWVRLQRAAPRMGEECSARRRARRIPALRFARPTQTAPGARPAQQDQPRGELQCAALRAMAAER